MRQTVRSGPFYVETGGRVVSLVAEVEVREVGKARTVDARPVAVYLIDDRGVQRLGARRGPRCVPVVLVGLLYAVWYVWRRFRR